MTAVELNRLLAARHSDGVYVPECKMGAAGSRTLDGWALLPTWSPLTTIGYEIKVSRSDWLQDQKYEEYRACCHLFFVVAPAKIVQRGEIPAGVGLLEPIGDGTGRRLVMRVKAVRQAPDDAKLARLMAYALMWRRVQANPMLDERPKRAVRWAQWVAEQQEFHVIGRSVSRRMRALVTAAQDAQQRAESRANRLEHAAALLRELGIDDTFNRFAVRREIERAIGGDRDALVRDVSSARQALQQLEQRLSNLSQREAVS